ncbi:MAG: ROK family protein [Phycisphaerae bacterium]|nr:ROK family protein [Phycisphaerae bacterium]
MSNRQIVLNLLRLGQPISRPQVAAALSISLPTAGGMVKQLLNSRLLIETGRSKSSGGRPAQLVQMNPDYAHAIGLTISSRLIQALLVNMAGQVIWEGETVASADSVDEVTSQAASQVSAALARSGDMPVSGIGVGISGVVDIDSGLSRSFPQLRDWKDVPIGEMLSEQFRLPIVVHNEVQAATLAELHYGCGRQTNNLLYLHLGKGIGLGLVSDGRLLRGSHGHAGEIGHTVVDPRGPVCYCGNYGCLESLASPPAVVRDAIAAIRQGVASSIATGRLDKLDEVTIQDVFTAAAKGDRLATNLLTAAGEHIGGAVANVANIFNPEMLVLGGVLAGGPPILVDAITRVFSARLLPVLVEKTAICVSQIRQQACGLGAATAIFDRLLEEADLFDRALT